MMKLPLLPALLALALAACSNDTAPVPASSTETETRDATDRDVRVRLGIVFTEADPWMAGAIVEQGTLRVGDRVALHSRDGRSASVQITAIRDDATQAAVAEAMAPQGVFLSFKPEKATPFGDAGSEAMLLGDPAAATVSPYAH